MAEPLNLSLQALRNTLDSSIIEKITPILNTNLKLERFQSFTEGNPEKLNAYILRVAEIYKRLNPYLTQVQVERDDAVWTDLFEKLKKWAVSYFITKRFDPLQVVNEMAYGQVSDAAIAIVLARFPYDIEFDPWAYVILENCCRKYIRSNLKASVIPPEKIEALDDILEETISGFNEEEQQAEKELRTRLHKAIEQLPPYRKLVIEQRYFEEIPPEQIAQRIGKSTAAVYSLQFNALQDLRKILCEKGID